MVDPISKEQAMNEGFEFQNLIQSPSWVVIKDEAETRISLALTGLVKIDASKVNEVMELQHQIKALRWLLDWPVTMAEQARAIEKESSQETEQDA